MKYLILIGDGMADDPVEALSGKTPLQAARTPEMDYLARHGKVGQVQLTPSGFSPGSDVTQLSLLGYDPRQFYTGRSPLEAASIGVSLEPEDVAFRCNLVTLRSPSGKLPERYSEDLIMEDYSGGHIPTDEARPIIKSLDQALKTDAFRFYPGISYRHLFVWKGGKTQMVCTPPHDFTGKPIGPRLPQGEGADVLNKLTAAAFTVLKDTVVNRIRLSQGEPPANGIWLWGQGKAPQLIPFKDRYGLSGSMISAVDLMKGIGIYAGFDIIKVPGATGYLDTNYLGKAEYALRELKENHKDIVYVHVEAPDEAGHNGDLSGKVQAIEDFDAKVVGTLRREMQGGEDFRILILPDHPTPVALKTHTPDPVPFILYDSREQEKGGKEYSEEEGRNSGWLIADGTELIEQFLKC
ncbi:MAG: cofactor-independent phosphoglycerate mutase [Nitrospirae bacterium]|nr:cofactor-independent phosphoglycerate mutase [Nitrospirota bacterium]